jgi:hypothetical protein
MWSRIRFRVGSGGWENGLDWAVIASKIAL